MDYSNLGFVIDNVGVQSVDKPDPKNSAIQKAFADFMKVKNEQTTKKPTVKTPEDPFVKFSLDMKFTTTDIDNEILTPKQKYVKNKERQRRSYKLDTEEFRKDKTKIQEVLAKSDVLKPGFEDVKAVPSQVVTEKKLKQQRQLEREKTKGNKWFNMPATEMTDEVKKDLQVLQMRSVLDPKHFYKKNDLKVLPKYFQIGKVEVSPLDFYNNRLTKKERKRTLVDELLADAEFTKYNKKKYAEVLVEKQKTHYKAHRQAKRLKRQGKK